MAKTLESIFEKSKKQLKNKRIQRERRELINAEVDVEKIKKDKALLETNIESATLHLRELLGKSESIRNEVLAFMLANGNKIQIMDRPMSCNPGGLLCTDRKYALAIRIKEKEGENYITTFLALAVKPRSKSGRQFRQTFVDRLHITAVTEGHQQPWGLIWKPAHFHSELPKKLQILLDQMAERRGIGPENMARILPMLLAKD